MAAKATPRLYSLSRLLLTRSLSSSPTFPKPTSSLLHVSRTRLLSSLPTNNINPSLPPSPPSTFRAFSTQNPNKNKKGSGGPSKEGGEEQYSKEDVMLDGCDMEHWLVVMDTPPSDWTRDQIIDSYVKTLSHIVGSEEEARKKIYMVSTKHYYAFGALVSEELSEKMNDLEGVQWVLPDSYLDVKNQDYGGEPFINGQAVPYHPKYHEEWVRNNEKAKMRNTRNDRPRNANRPGNSERRQRPQGSQNNRNPAANAGRAGGNMGAAPNQPNGVPSNAVRDQNRPPHNAGHGQNLPPSNNPGSTVNTPPNN